MSSLVVTVTGSPSAGSRTAQLAQQVGAALFALTSSHLAVQVLKRAVARARPCDANGRLLALIDLPDPYSFPSGHAAAASAMRGHRKESEKVKFTKGR